VAAVTAAAERQPSSEGQSGGAWGQSGGEEGAYTLEQTDLFSGVRFELGTGAVVAPLEALVAALRPGGRGRIRWGLGWAGRTGRALDTPICHQT
jgi:hypothetical protein